MFTTALGTIEEGLVPGRLLFLAARIAGANLLTMFGTAVRTEELGSSPRGDFRASAVLAGTRLLFTHKPDLL